MVSSWIFSGNACSRFHDGMLKCTNGKMSQSFATAPYISTIERIQRNAYIYNLHLWLCVLLFCIWHSFYLFRATISNYPYDSPANECMVSIFPISKLEQKAIVLVLWGVQKLWILWDVHCFIWQINEPILAREYSVTIGIHRSRILAIKGGSETYLLMFWEAANYILNIAWKGLSKFNYATWCVSNIQSCALITAGYTPKTGWIGKYSFRRNQWIHNIPKDCLWDTRPRNVTLRYSLKYVMPYY